MPRAKKKAKAGQGYNNNSTDGPTIIMLKTKYGLDEGVVVHTKVTRGGRKKRQSSDCAPSSYETVSGHHLPFEAEGVDWKWFGADSNQETVEGASAKADKEDEEEDSQEGVEEATSVPASKEEEDKDCSVECTEVWIDPKDSSVPQEEIEDEPLSKRSKLLEKLHEQEAVDDEPLSKSSKLLEKLHEREAALQRVLQDKDATLKEAIARSRKTMAKVSELQQARRTREGQQAKQSEEVSMKLATVHKLTEDLKGSREMLRRMEAKEALLDRQQAAGEEEIRTLLQEAARSGAALEASVVMERPNTKDAATLWANATIHAGELEKHALEQAKAQVIACEARVQAAWSAVMNDRVAIDQSRLAVAQLKVDRDMNA